MHSASKLAILIAALAVAPIARAAKTQTEIDLGNGVTATHVLTTGEDGRTTESVLVSKAGDKIPREIWKADTSWRGEPGERVAEAVRFEDLNRDGRLEIAVGRVSEAVHLCGAKDLPLLDRRVYDPVSGTLRRVLARRPELPEPTDVIGKADPAGGPVASVVKAASPASASVSIGGRGEPGTLAVPHQVADGNAATAWIAGPGNGAGEFVSFDVLAGTYGVTRVGVRAVPEGLDPKRYDRPRSLLLSVDGKVFRLRFPDDPAASPGATVWFDLGASSRTECASFVIEESFAPKAARGLAVAEIAILTEADADGGLERLAHDLNDEGRRRQAGMLLARAGEASAQALKEAWPSLDEAGRRRAVLVLAEVAPAPSADLLAEATVSADEATADAGRRGLLRAGAAAVPALARFLADADDHRFKAAANMLAGADFDAALDALCAATGRGGAARREILRQRVSMAASAGEARALRLWAAVESGSGEALLDLIRAAAGVPALAGRLAPLALRLYGASTSFADRHRLLPVLAVLGGNEPSARLVDATKDPDPLIRAQAVAGLARASDDGQAREALRRAIADDAVEVRLAALGVLSSGPIPAEVAGGLDALAAREPWPEIRAAVALLASRLEPKVAIGILTRLSRDASPAVRLATMRAAAHAGGADVARLVTERLRADKETPEVLVAAARAAEIRCEQSALDALDAVLARGAEPLASSTEIEPALAAARAMGAIGGNRAKELLEARRKRSNPATDRAIDAALAGLGRPCRERVGK
ncbi:MAG: hypothetical protein PHU25_10190 [Deltaproteobacteria bacterium]|nr:hypothetical protein [Deltaproteobacteria bacterium]